MKTTDAEIIGMFTSCVLDHIKVEEFIETKDRMITRIKIPKKAQIIIDSICKHLKEQGLEERDQAEVESELFSFLIVSGITKTVEIMYIKGGAK